MVVWQLETITNRLKGIQVLFPCKSHHLWNKCSRSTTTVEKSHQKYPLWESNPLASASQPQWKLTTTLTRIASSTETKINKLMYLTIADCQPFNIFYNLTGCRSNSHCVMKKVYRRCYLHFPWICDFLQIILSDHSLAVSSMMLSFGYAHIYYKGKIFIHFQIFVYSVINPLNARPIIYGRNTPVKSSIAGDRCFLAN